MAAGAGCEDYIRKEVALRVPPHDARQCEFLSGRPLGNTTSMLSPEPEKSLSVISKPASARSPLAVRSGRTTVRNVIGATLPLRLTSTGAGKGPDCAHPRMCPP